MEEKGHHRLSRLLPLTFEPLPGIPLIEIAGTYRVLVENHLGVVAYGCNEICIRVKYGVVRIEGSKLEISKLSAQQLVVNGMIDQVVLDRR